jgi:integrase/recombinase XerD
MLERYFRQGSALHRVRTNPVGQELEYFAAWLNQRGYASGTIRLYLTAVAHFGNWLGEQAISVDSITDHLASLFLCRHLPRCRCRFRGPGGKDAPAALVLFIEALRKAGHIPPAVLPKPKPLDREVAGFETHLRTTCALAEDTVIYRIRYAREFLEAIYGSRLPKLSDLTPDQVSDFVFTEARHLKPASVKVLASSLRSYLRFVCFRGRCPRDLSCAVPTVAAWKKSHIPKTLSQEQIEKFLSYFDRSTATGRRDYALCLCLSELGLRSGEVANLSLDDFDWRAGTISIASGKAGRSRLLPLPKRLGRAIVEYIRNGRPASGVRRVFLRHSLPKGEPITRGIVANVVARGWSEVDCDALPIGPHVFRHSAATRLHERGATFKDIADVLGHQQIDTVSIYAKVNLLQLAQVALPWLEEQKL